MPLEKTSEIRTVFISAEFYWFYSIDVWDFQQHNKQNAMLVLIESDHTPQRPILYAAL